MEFFLKKTRQVEAISMIVGTAIGAGILGLPYAVSKVGFPLGIVLLLILGVANIILQLMLAEITLRTKKDHQIIGYGGLYLGSLAKKIALVVGVMGGYGTLLAYIIGEGRILQALMGGGGFWWSLAFSAFVAIVVYRGLDTIKRFEVVLVGFMLLVISLIAWFSGSHVSLERLSYINLGNIFLPYGVLLFSLTASAVIPEVRKQLKGDEGKFPFVIISANVLVMLIYMFFMYVVLGVTGQETTEIATIGLGQKIGPQMVLLGNVLALFTICTSFMTIGLAIKRVFILDYKFNNIQALMLTMGPPLAFFLAGSRNFVEVIGLVGGVLLGIQSTIIVFTFWKAHIHGDRRPEFSIGELSFTGLFLIGIFAIGAIVTIFGII